MQRRRNDDFRPHGLITNPTAEDLYKRAHIGTQGILEANPKEIETCALMAFLMNRNFTMLDDRYSVAAEWYPDPVHGEQADIVVRYCQSGDKTQQILMIGECKKTTRTSAYSLKGLEWQAFRYCQMYFQSDEGRGKEEVYAATMAGAHMRFWRSTKDRTFDWKQKVPGSFGGHWSDLETGVILDVPDAIDREFGLNLSKMKIGAATRHPHVLTSKLRLPPGIEEKMAVVNVNRELFAGTNTSTVPASSFTSANSAGYRSSSNRYEQASSSTSRASAIGASGSNHAYPRTMHRSEPSASSTYSAVRPTVATASNRARATASSRLAAVAPTRSERYSPENEVRSERSTPESDYGPHNNWGLKPIDHFPKERMQELEAKRRKRDLEMSAGRYNSQTNSIFSGDQYRDERSIRHPTEPTRTAATGYSIDRQGDRYQDTAGSGRQPSTSQISAGRPTHSSSERRDPGRMNPAGPSQSSARYDDMSPRTRWILIRPSITRSNIEFNTGLGMNDSDPRDWKDGTVDGKRAKILKYGSNEYYYLIGGDGRSR
ncbi:hypothetical protein BCON_0450g00050 [Botryotinia convoluta]|uniref:Uncharacterized protein n=1 Tax=Botryotinia convoluta TaxID=54673 RepID=A0A4Z1H757_9HELO|nr:hypothetical protein BCON_0450g00050 [Botryotinia convoluta]